MPQSTCRNSPFRHSLLAVAVVILDTLGGQDGPQIGSAEGVETTPETTRTSTTPPELRGKAREGLDGRWRMLHPEILRLVTRTNSPNWHERALAAAAAVPTSSRSCPELGRRTAARAIGLLS
jgi:hypothetical protein